MNDMLFAALVIGHLVGDYPLQNLAMMLGKSKPGLDGYVWCSLHCLFYTAAVYASLYWFAGIGGPAIALTIFASHWPIDRWSLADKWMGAIHSRRRNVTYKNSKEIDAAFYVAVYIMTDIALHLAPLMVVLKLIGI